MHERVRREIELLKGKYPDLRHGDNIEWVLIPDYSLPKDRYNKTQTKVLFIIPPGYPNTGPDNFFVDADLRLKDGGMPPALNPGPQSSSGTAPIPGDWAWFSWHPKDKEWRPASNLEDGDNLITFLRGVSMCLRGEEAP